uniref:Uncharacterized protein n=1 Tax=Amphimedon queenslandica TaxID=400682 RepID=A0A1X7VRE9_AMPQE
MAASEKPEKTTKYSKWWSVSKTFSYGFILGISLLPAIKFYQRLRLPKPRKLQSSLLPMLRANNEIREAIGSSLRVGLLSAHSYRGGLVWTLPTIRRGPSFLRSLLPFRYQPPTLEVLFQVIGDKDTAMVSLMTETPADARRHGKELRSLHIDFNNGARLVLKGSTTSDASNSEPTSVEYKNWNQ